MKTHFEGRGDPATFRSITADGEADSEVRKFARGKLALGNTVYIMSGDASLLLGLDPALNVFAIGLDSLSITQNVPYSLTGKLYRLRTVLARLGLQANDVLNSNDIPRDSAVTGDMLVYVAALLGGETSFIRRGNHDQPYPILMYIKKVLPRYEGPKLPFKTQIFYVAVVAVRGWLSSGGIIRATGPSDDFIESIASHATRAAYNNNNYATERLHGLQSWSSTNAGIRRAASELLNVETLGGVRPDGFAVPVFRQKVSLEIRKRREDSLDTAAPLINDRKTEWGCKVYFEVPGEDTRQLMAPLNTLITQIDYIKSANGGERSEFSRERSEVVSMVLNNSCEPPYHHFNTFLRSLVESLAADIKSEGVEYTILQTHNVPRNATDHRMTIIGLDSNLRLRNTIPDEGVIVKEAGDVMGLHFFTLLGDAIDRKDAYCKADVRYTAHGTPPAAAGTLLDLHVRSQYLTLLYFNESTPAVENEPEKAAAIVFERLGLPSMPEAQPHAIFSSRISTALLAISKCWSLLPCSVSLRNRLVSMNPSADTAKLLFATVYCYTALFAQTHATSSLPPGRPPGKDALMGRVALALIMCPLFSIDTADNCPAIDLFSTSDPRHPCPDINATSKAFSDRLVMYNNQFITPNASTFSKRVSACVDCVFESVRKLIGYDASAADCWVKHCRWYNLRGVQRVIEFLDAEGAGGRRVGRAGLGVSDLLQAAMERAPGTVPFTEAAVLAMDAVVLALQGV